MCKLRPNAGLTILFFIRLACSALFVVKLKHYKRPITTAIGRVKSHLTRYTDSNCEVLTCLSTGELCLIDR